MRSSKKMLGAFLGFKKRVVFGEGFYTGGRGRGSGPGQGPMGPGPLGPWALAHWPMRIGPWSGLGPGPWGSDFRSN